MGVTKSKMRNQRNVSWQSKPIKRNETLKEKVTGGRWLQKLWLSELGVFPAVMMNSWHMLLKTLKGQEDNFI